MGCRVVGGSVKVMPKIRIKGRSREKTEEEKTETSLRRFLCEKSSSEITLELGSEKFLNRQIRPLFVYFRSFANKQNNFKNKSMLKITCPCIRCRDSNPQPLRHESRLPWPLDHGFRPRFLKANLPRIEERGRQTFHRLDWARRRFSQIFRRIIRPAFYLKGVTGLPDNFPLQQKDSLF